MVRRVYFFRHGEADWPHWDRPDEERPLNKKGAKETQRMAKLLRKNGTKVDLILSSPLPRALQTAQIVAEELGTPLMEENDLSQGATPKELRGLLEHYGEKSTLVVGHEPDFSRMLADLTGGSRLKIAKSGVARVDLEVSEQEGLTTCQGKLIWLIPPKALNT